MNFNMLNIEPHAEMLSTPGYNKHLYKVMDLDNLISSIKNSYLYFNRVDCYKDFPEDGAELPMDIQTNQNTKFEKASDISWSKMLNQFRRRTYACCFSLKNTTHLWRKYPTGDYTNKICLVFKFGKLRHQLNNTFNNCILSFDGAQYDNIFSINYGNVNYIDRTRYQSNIHTLTNIIEYIYYKNITESDDKELRISLSSIFPSQYIAHEINKFPNYFHVPFDFKQAFQDQTIVEIIVSSQKQLEYCSTELGKLGVSIKVITI